MTSVPYRTFTTTRVSVTNGAWNAITVPTGAIDAQISLENPAASFRLTSDNAIALTEGVPVAAGESYALLGSASDDVVVYVNPTPSTFVVLQVQGA